VIVLDSSALIALLRGEKGGEAVALRLEGSHLSSANLAETLTKATEWVRDPVEVLKEIKQLPMRIVPVSEAQALTAALLRPLTRSAGLSLGDRLCLALALSLGCPALSAESAWVGLPHNVEVELIR
jgi:ribonuclease VapC